MWGCHATKYETIHVHINLTESKLFIKEYNISGDEQSKVTTLPPPMHALFLFIYQKFTDFTHDKSDYMKYFIYKKRISLEKEQSYPSLGYKNPIFLFSLQILQPPSILQNFPSYF